MTVRTRNLNIAIAFLLPNFLGFLAFTLVPIIISFLGSFTTWSLSPAVPFEIIGFDNYLRLFTDKYFYFYFYNTFYFMLTLPVSIIGSLLLAVFLSDKFNLRGFGGNRRLAAASLVITIFVSGLMVLGGRPNLGYFLGALGLVGALGFRFGSICYRTVFYLPHFTAGAATIVMWSQLYNPNFGIINQVIERTADFGGWTVNPPGWLSSTQSMLGLLPFPPHFNSGGFGLGAREAIMLMGLWAGFGGNQMLLYLAGIANIPKELYEAAEIDGAGWWQKLRFVTIPQLAPVTFFILVMGVIGGLQGGFEQVRLMTEGGPAGTTTTLIYYIYQQGFERLDLGYGSAVAWVLFTVIFAFTMVNWKYGKQGYSY